MYLVDTSVWVNLLRDRTGQVRTAFEQLVGDEAVFLSRWTQMELLQGCRDEREWDLLRATLEDQDYAEAPPTIWVSAARLYFDLRRRGLTIRSSVDCCIAQLALDYQLILVHDDRDFEVIQQVWPLQCMRFPHMGG